MKILTRVKDSIQESPPRFLVTGFLFVIIIGALLLHLPISSREGIWTPLLDCFFTATSATCVTGLVTLNTAAHWTTFGHVIIMLLIQIGGLCFMTVATLMALLLGKRITLRDRLIIQEQMNTFSLSGMVKLIRYVIVSTLIIEGIGAVLLSFKFIPMFGLKGIWFSIFHSISSFCNAGFDIIGPNSLNEFINSPLIMLTVSFLIILGGVGFNVYMDITSKKFNFKKYTLHTKIVLVMTSILLLVGFFGVLLLEFDNPETIGNQGALGKILGSWFQSTTVRTAGYTAFDQAALRDSTAVICILLMFIGGSPAGTAGGIKTTTFAALWMVLLNEIRGNEDIVVFKRRVRFSVIRKAIAILMIGVLWVAFVIFMMLIVEPYSLLDISYEAVSAFATVGLTRNLTPNLTAFSQVLIIISMYLGRVGTMTLVFALANKKRRSLYKEAYGNIIIG